MHTIRAYVEPRFVWKRLQLYTLRSRYVSWYTPGASANRALVISTVGIPRSTESYKSRIIRPLQFRGLLRIPTVLLGIGRLPASREQSHMAAAASLEPVTKVDDDEEEDREGQPYDDLIKFPDEEPPPPEVWEVEPKYEWEKDERGYIYEERLSTAEEHKNEGNKHYALAESGDDSQWSIALRRYRRAIYHCHFDEMQMHDFLEQHQEQAIAIQMNCKLNLAACIVQMYELKVEDAEHALPEGDLNHAVLAVNEVLEKRPKEPKAHYRKGQLLMLQADLPGARACLAEAKKLGGHAGDIGNAMRELKRLEREERERERALYGGKIQKVALHPAEEAATAKAAARRQLLLRLLAIVAFPVTAPWQLLRHVLKLARPYALAAMGTQRGVKDRKAE